MLRPPCELRFSVRNKINMKVLAFVDLSEIINLIVGGAPIR